MIPLLCLVLWLCTWQNRPVGNRAHRPILIKHLINSGDNNTLDIKIGNCTSIYCFSICIVKRQTCKTAISYVALHRLETKEKSKTRGERFMCCKGITPYMTTYPLTTLTTEHSIICLYMVSYYDERRTTKLRT